MKNLMKAITVLGIVLLSLGAIVGCVEEHERTPVESQLREPQNTTQRKEASGFRGIPDDKMTWVKCNNPACKAEYEMSEKQYYRELVANTNGNLMTASTTVITCIECNTRSLAGAEKCANKDCRIVFIEGICGPADFPDRCPDCGQSKIEESRNRRLEQWQR